MRPYYTLLEKIELDKLVLYGFDTNYEYSFLLSHSFLCFIKYKDNQFFVKVVDRDGEEYYPFYVINAAGKVVGELRTEVDQKIEDILRFTKIKNTIKEKVLSYVRETYGVLPKFPFPKDSVSMTLTNDKNKWFGLLMQVKASVLGLASEEIVTILNIKCNPEKIEQIIDNQNYFRAYHMNKKYWLTILLNNQIAFEEIKNLLDNSYLLVNL